MKNKTWRDNIRRGKDKCFIMKTWKNNMPKRWTNYERAEKALLRNESMWGMYYGTYYK